MLETVKSRGDLVAAHRPTSDSIYIEGIIQKVLEDEGDYFYEIAWEDGKHFGVKFYEGELDEIDLAESEATVRAALSYFLPEDAIDEWLELPNPRLKDLSPLAALASLGLRKVATVAIDDYGDSLREPELIDSRSPEEKLEDQLKDILG